MHLPLLCVENNRKIANSAKTVLPEPVGAQTSTFSSD